jgi:uncharacterized protein with PQ loop repeat
VPPPPPRAIDNAMAAAAIVHPATAAPQVIKIYETHNAVGVAPLTWLSFMAIGTVFWPTACST